jgi:hypothetical protein
MADTKPSEASKPAAQEPKSEPKQSQPAAQSAQPRQGNSGQSEDPGAGLAGALQTQFETRTQVPGHPGIDARLDNRAGAFRPPLEEWPAKPQQIDGPDVAHQVEHTRATLQDREQDLGPRKGAFSIGSHGLSTDESLREGRAVQGPDEG